MYSHSLAVTLKILLLRAGPQDLPYSRDLSRVLFAVGLLSASFVLGTGVPPYAALMMSATGIAGNAAFSFLLLQQRGLANRFQQTFNAQLAVGSVFALALLPAFITMAPEMARIAKDPALLERLRDGDSSVLNIPLWAGLGIDIAFIWSLAVNTHILRQSTGAGLLRASLLTVALFFFILSMLSLAQALFAGPP